MEPTLHTPQASGLRRYRLRILIAIVLIFIGFLIYGNEPPQAFPIGSIVTVQSGDTFTSVAKELKVKHIIRSTLLFKGVLILSAGNQKLIAGDYYFSEPISLRSVVSRLVNGHFDLTPVKVTIPEGISMHQIATILSAKLTNFSEADFMKYSPEKEGFLFPDTYFFMPNTKAENVIEVLQKNFEDKIKTVEPTIVAFGKSEKDVVTMASILEDEAQTTEDWQIISSILWKRIKIGMPLQVDSTLGYVTGKASSGLTTADLKMKSPYNTYLYKGLPPTPIGNPGIKTITAAATPTSTPYLYYLSDKNGVIHYAATFAEHVRNKQQYIK